MTKMMMQKMLDCLDIDPDLELTMRQLKTTTKTESWKLTTLLDTQEAATGSSLRRKRSWMSSTKQQTMRVACRPAALRLKSSPMKKYLARRRTKLTVTSCC